MPPDPTRRSPAGGPGLVQNAELRGYDKAHITANFIRGRERVLGRRLLLHREPAIAAALLVEELGPLGARAWVRTLLDELGR